MPHLRLPDLRSRERQPAFWLSLSHGVLSLRGVLGDVPRTRLVQPLCHRFARPVAVRIEDALGQEPDTSERHVPAIGKRG